MYYISMKKYYEKADIKEIYIYISKKFKIQKKSFLLFSVLFLFTFLFYHFFTKIRPIFRDFSHNISPNTRKTSL